jgi:hypothetical protein
MKFKMAHHVTCVFNPICFPKVNPLRALHTMSRIELLALVAGVYLVFDKSDRIL